MHFVGTEGPHMGWIAGVFPAQKFSHTMLLFTCMVCLSCARPPVAAGFAHSPRWNAGYDATHIIPTAALEKEIAVDFRQSADPSERPNLVFKTPTDDIKSCVHEVRIDAAACFLDVLRCHLGVFEGTSHSIPVHVSNRERQSMRHPCMHMFTPIMSAT
eukprot:3641295-Rhodomonas_salina.1